MILILSTEDDVHALAVKRELDRGDVACGILAVDRISGTDSLSFCLDRRTAEAHVRASFWPNRISIDDVDLIWYRRPRADQADLDPSLGEAAKALINNECRGAALGMIASSFRGTWVSKPGATLRAADKLFQLRVARDCGFPIPDTLVSQDLDRVQEFYEEHCGRIIVKSIVGVEEAFLLTRAMPRPSDLEREAFLACPALYQANVPGHRHIRLVCFGDESLAAVIESNDLDWRPNLNVPIRAWDVPGWVHARVRRVLDELDLEMGVVDIKETPSGELVWLEVNPQGQFLFLEGLTDLHLAARFASYLVRTASATSKRVTTPPGSPVAAEVASETRSSADSSPASRAR